MKDNLSSTKWAYTQRSIERTRGRGDKERESFLEEKGGPNLVHKKNNIDFRPQKRKEKRGASKKEKLGQKIIIRGKYAGEREGRPEKESK